jgi:hypothetical protein
MKDKLENFVENHRDMFDDESPSADLWNKIDSAIPEKRKRFYLHPLAYAASLVAVAVVSWLTSTLFAPNSNLNAGNGLSVNTIPSISAPVFNNTDTVYIALNNSNLIAQTTSANTISDDEKVFNEITAYYNSEIESRKTKLLMLSSGNEEIIDQIEEELAMIESANNKTMNDLGDDCNVGKVMENMIGNYRQSIDILDMMLDQLNEEYALTNTNGYEN